MGKGGGRGLEETSISWQGRKVDIGSANIWGGSLVGRGKFYVLSKTANAATDEIAEIQGTFCCREISRKNASTEIYALEEALQIATDEKISNKQRSPYDRGLRSPAMRGAGL